MNCASGTPAVKSTPASLRPWTTSFAFSNFILSSVVLISLTNRLVKQVHQLSDFWSPAQRRNHMKLALRLHCPGNIFTRSPPALILDHDFARFFGEVIVQKQSRRVGMRCPGGYRDRRWRPDNRRTYGDKIYRRLFLLEGNRVVDVAVHDQIMLAGSHELRHKSMRLS